MARFLIWLLLSSVEKKISIVMGCLILHKLHYLSTKESGEECKEILLRENKNMLYVFPDVSFKSKTSPHWNCPSLHSCFWTSIPWWDGHHLRTTIEDHKNFAQLFINHFQLNKCDFRICKKKKKILVLCATNSVLKQCFQLFNVKKIRTPFFFPSKNTTKIHLLPSTAYADLNKTLIT